MVTKISIFMGAVKQFMQRLQVPDMSRYENPFTDENVYFAGAGDFFLIVPTR